MDHSPSGNFNPTVDSYGRVIFTRWDHLQRDQQNIGASLGAYNFESEISTTPLSTPQEVFPEARSVLDPAYRSNINLFNINQFFPWMMQQDGTGLETLNLAGRQEIGLYSERSFNDDPNVQEFYGQYSTGQNSNEFTIFLHIRENPTQAGTYVGTSCQEFGSHSGGVLITICSINLPLNFFDNFEPNRRLLVYGLTQYKYFVYSPKKADLSAGQICFHCA